MPIRVIAAAHDPSVPTIEARHSEFMADQTDDISQAAILEIAAPKQANIVRILAAGESDPTATTPARLFGLFQRKGTIAPRSDAASRGSDDE